MGAAAESPDHVQILIDEFTQPWIDAFEGVGCAVPLFGIFSRESPASLKVLLQHGGIGLGAYRVFELPALRGRVENTGQDLVIDTTNAFVANLVQLHGVLRHCEPRGQLMLVSLKRRFPQSRLTLRIENGGELAEKLRMGPP